MTSTADHVIPEVEALDRLLLLLSQCTRDVEKAAVEGMWRTWKLDAFREAHKNARAAATIALAVVPVDLLELRAKIERQLATLDELAKKYRAA